MVCTAKYGNSLAYWSAVQFTNLSKIVTILGIIVANFVRLRLTIAPQFLHFG